MKYILQDGKAAMVMYDVLNIKRPLISVGKLRKSGREVHLGKQGEESYIKKGHRKAQVLERNNVFCVRRRRVPESL